MEKRFVIQRISGFGRFSGMHEFILETIAANDSLEELCQEGYYRDLLRGRIVIHDNYSGNSILAETAGVIGSGDADINQLVAWGDIPEGMTEKQPGKK